jgi:hypothetical protein
MSGRSRPTWAVLGLGAQLIVAGQVLAADVYQATARFTNAEGERVTTPVTISLEGSTPETERAALAEKAKAKPDSAKELLTGQKVLGYIEAPQINRRVPIKYANVQAGGDGQFITVLSDEPLGHIGGNEKYVKAKGGFDLTYANVMVNASGQGRGELAPACKIKFMPSGAPAVDDYGSQVVWLDDVKKAAAP